MLSQRLSVPVSVALKDDLRALARLQDVPVSDFVAELLQTCVDHFCRDVQVAQRVRELSEEIGHERAARRDAPGVAKTFFLGEDLLGRYEAVYRSWLGKLGPIARGHLFEAVLDAGLAHLEDLPPQRQLPRLAGPEGRTREGRTFWLSREIVQRLADEHQRRNTAAPLKKPALVEMVVAAGLNDLEERLNQAAPTTTRPSRKTKPKKPPQPGSAVGRRVPRHATAGRANGGLSEEVELPF